MINEALMTIEVRQVCHPEAVRHFGSADLRRHFLIEELFVPGRIKLTYSHIDRLVVGGATPTQGHQARIAQADRLANSGPARARRRQPRWRGRVHTDGKVHDLAPRDALYVAMGTKECASRAGDAATRRSSISSALRLMPGSRR